MSAYIQCPKDQTWVQRYAFIFPDALHLGHTEHACLHMEEIKGLSQVQVSLISRGSTIILVERTFPENPVFTCLPMKVPNVRTDDSVHRLIFENAELELTIKNSEKNIREKRPVSLKTKKRDPAPQILIQTDKSVYKPGQTVKFRIVSLDANFKPADTQLPIVELQDPETNRIGQWLDVKLRQGMTDLSFPLSSEPQLGEYVIVAKNTIHKFRVEEYVLPRFEVIFELPRLLLSNTETFPVKICARYTFGKSVSGQYKGSLCRRNMFGYVPSLTRKHACVHFKGKLDKQGCAKLTMKSYNFYLQHSTYNMQMSIQGKATVTEEGTDGNGRAAFMLNNTENWVDKVDLTASTMAESTPHLPYFYDLNTPHDMNGHLTLLPLYSDSKSYLSLQPAGDILSCDPEEEAHVEYIIRRIALEENTSPLILHYLVTSKNTILTSGSHDIPIIGPNKDLHGEVTFKLPVGATDSSTFNALVFILLPNGEIIADSVKIRDKKCFKNQVKVGFSPDEVLPGSDVSLQVQAAPGSLCGVRVVDQSVVLLKPDKELTVEKVGSCCVRFVGELHWLDVRNTRTPSKCNSSHFKEAEIPEWEESRAPADALVHALFFDDEFPLYPASGGLTLEPHHCLNRPGEYHQFPFDILIAEDEIYKLFMDINLNIITSAPTRKPLLCPDSLGSEPDDPALRKPEVIRKYFPETWIWELTPVGDSGIAELHRPVPDTITDWNAGAMCMGPTGFGLSPPVPLRVFQPFFVELALPYSVVRGESFTLKASVFNYLQHCIKVQIDLLPSLELEQELCSKCQYSSCLCAEESKTFYWNVTASKLGEVNITVRTEAINTPDMCNNEIPVVPKQGNTDTIIKPLIVKPGGVLVEKSHNFMICIPVGQAQATPEEFSLKVPEDILKDSERAYVTLFGDMMGTAMQNMDRLLAMPYGCGEQNMVLFAPNIFVLQYLEKTHQLTDEIKSKATELMEQGYQRQLNYKHADGSYSAYGNSEDGNTWLTAFVVKSFTKAKKHIYIDETRLSQSLSWLTGNRYYTGCFRNVGKLFHSALKGGVEDDVSLSAYVTIALLEADVPKDSLVVRGSVICLQRLALSVTNMYTQALLAYAFTLYGDWYHRQIMLNRLEQRAVRRNGELYWQPRPTSPSDPFWHRAPSTEVELTSYVLLALLSASPVDFGGASQIVKWLSKQQNAFGGFSSTQDTVVALQALAKYAEAVYSGTRDGTVTISSKAGFLEKFHVNNKNRLVFQKTTLPGNPENYTVTTTGSGCVYVQTVLRYNLPARRSHAAFMMTLDVKSIQCTRNLPTQLELNIAVVYVGARLMSNMAIIDVNMLSGFTAVKSSIELLKTNRVIRRAETGDDSLTLYLEEIGRSPIRFALTVEQEFPVINLKPTTVKVYDYYETNEFAIVDYHSPCTW
ncbi:PREDICTED: pregnancy zone protein-like [Nanorana parkeri]|uniref:pregnancy zone protein-like n=1 Tax=Nanorana parkeri TaxID=125878 RepID=UPI000854D40F|nr:PREDICTED: pregnancy zone protein-like [Nanorana parkeri]